MDVGGSGPPTPKLSPRGLWSLAWVRIPAAAHLSKPAAHSHASRAPLYFSPGPAAPTAFHGTSSKVLGCFVLRLPCRLPRGGGVTAAPPSFQRFLGGGGDVCKRPHPVPGSGDVPGRRRRCLSAPADETPALTLASPHPTGSAGSSRTPPSSGRSAALALARRRLGMEPATWMRTRTCRYRWPRGPADTGGLEPPGLAGLALGHRPPAGPGPPAR